MADTEAKKILDNIWASDPLASREEIEDLGIDWATGWTVAYEQIGSGKTPERTGWNQLLRALNGWASDRIRMGIPQWDAKVNYRKFAFATTSQGIVVAKNANGPLLGNGVDPIAVGQTAWRLY